MILYAVRLVVSTISLSNIVIGKQKLDLVFQFVLLLISIITSVIAFVMKLSFVEFIILNSTGLSFGYILFYILLYYFAKSKNQEVIK